MNAPFRHAFDSDIYASGLATILLPDSVVGTRDRSKETAAKGGERSPAHDVWIVDTDGDTKRNSTFEIAFDGIVAPGATLADPRFFRDALTKRIMLARVLTVGLKRSPMSAQGAFKLAQHFDWLVRWRESTGIDRNSGLSERDFEDFLRRLKGSDVLQFVPIRERLDALCLELAAVAPASLDWQSLAKRLGVTVASISTSPWFRSLLAERLAGIDLARSLRFRGNSEQSSPRQWSARTVEGFIAPWQALSFLSAQGLLDHDPLRFDPLENRDIRTVALGIGRARERTGTLPPPDLLRLMDAAARWVLEYSDAVLEAVDLLSSKELNPDRRKAKERRIQLSRALDGRLPDGMPRLWLSWRSDNGSSDEPDLKSRLAVSQAIKHLMLACLILIGTFGARRVGEVTSLKAGCATEDQAGLPTLSIYIEKTLRELDRIPVPAIVRSAVLLLEKITKNTRQATSNDWLFEYMRSNEAGTRVFLGFKPDELMDEFARLNGLPVPQGWDDWNLKPHQLRRGFAVFYYHGFRFSSLDALSRHLRHFDPEMTRIYVNEIIAGAMGRLREEINARTAVGIETMSEDDRNWLAEAKSLLDDLAGRSSAFEEVRCEALVHRMLGMWSGSEKPVGQGAAKLYADLDRMVEKAAADIRLTSRSNDPDAVRKPLERMLKSYATQHYLEPVPGAAAHCTARPGNRQDLADAECLKRKAASRGPWSDEPAAEDIWPDHGFSGSYACLSCVHCAAFAENLEVIGRDLEWLGTASERGGGINVKATAAAKYEKLKAALAAARAATAERA